MQGLTLASELGGMLVREATWGKAAVEVDFDLSVLGQVALFVVLMLVLKPTLFDPMLKLFEEREKRTLGAKAEARKMDEASALALGKYETAMQKARGEANLEREKLRAEGIKAEGEILGKARAKMAETLEAGRVTLRSEGASIRTAMKNEAASVANDVAARVLGREVSG